jgi:hypothetical protein
MGSTPQAVAQALDASQPANASSSNEPVTVSLEGHAGCRDSEFFLQQLLARTPRAHRAAAGETGRAFVVQIVKQEPNSTGTLVVRDATGAESTRVVTAATCDEVIAALALVAALTIDPQAVTTPLEVPPVDTPKPSPTLTPPAPPPKSPPRTRTAPPEAKTPGADRASEPDASARRQVRLGAQAAAEVMSGFEPDVALLPRGMIELELELARQSWLAPSLRLSAARGEGSTTVAGVGRATFVWTGGRLEICPVRAGRGVGPYARPCLGTDVAAIVARGHDLPETRSATRPWVAPLATARAGWRFPFGLSIELYAGGSFPLVDDKFEFDDRRNGRRVQVHEIPTVSLFAGVAAGMSGAVF